MDIELVRLILSKANPFLLIFSMAFSFLQGEVRDQKWVLDIENALLPKEHPLQEILPGLFSGTEMFDSDEALKESGFRLPENQHNSYSGIMVGFHPSISGYLIKKHNNRIKKDEAVDRYLVRIQGANAIAQYIEKNNCKHLTVPKKWLYQLPSSFDDPLTGSHDFVLIVEDMDICEGGWWGGDTLEKYRKMDADVLKELCYALHDLEGCDAWPQNQPFTHSGKIAFIDTEHLGLCYGDFLERTIRFINPNLVKYARRLWDERQKMKEKKPSIHKVNKVTHKHRKRFK